MRGYIHSIQSLGAVDGPGVRSVVFMQGCALRCAYCHNPDTWDKVGEAEIMTPEELVKKLLRFRSYFGEKGGVTISGGEPLLQAEFVAEVFRLLKEAGIHTALDTAGQICDERARKVLKYTDLALVDVKFLANREYQTHAKGSLEKVQEFLKLTEQMQIPIWIRHVMVPDLTATEDYLKQIKEMAESYSNLEKIEWLPFHNLCKEKYEKMNLTFPLADTRVMTPEEVKELLKNVTG